MKKRKKGAVFDGALHGDKEQSAAAAALLGASQFVGRSYGKAAAPYGIAEIDVDASKFRKQVRRDNHLQVFVVEDLVFIFWFIQNQPQ